MAEVKFEDYSLNVKNAIRETAIAFLYEVAGELTSQTKRNTKVKTSQTKGSFRYVVDESALSATVGSSYDNAMWEELGTGIYAQNGDGRQTPWFYKDEKGVGHFTHGKRPRQMLQRAFASLKGDIIKEAERRFGELNDS